MFGIDADEPETCTMPTDAHRTSCCACSVPARITTRDAVAQPCRHAHHCERRIHHMQPVCANVIVVVVAVGSRWRARAGTCSNRNYSHAPRVTYAEGNDDPFPIQSNNLYNHIRVRATEWDCSSHIGGSSTLNSGQQIRYLWQWSHDDNMYKMFSFSELLRTTSRQVETNNIWLSEVI